MAFVLSLKLSFNMTREEAIKNKRAEENPATIRATIQTVWFVLKDKTNVLKMLNKMATLSRVTFLCISLIKITKIAPLK